MKEGAIFGTTEQKLPGHISKDLFGFIDGVAVHPEKGIIGIQVTMGNNGPARVEKIREQSFCWPRAELWLRFARIEVWDWRPKQVGGRRRWCVRIAEVKDRESPVVWEEK